MQSFSLEKFTFTDLSLAESMEALHYQSNRSGLVRFWAFIQNLSDSSEHVCPMLVRPVEPETHNKLNSQ